MPSIIPGYEYDIFISYRLKDNKGDRWVTDFVEALRSELETTFKEDLNIYFDENPHDGLLETHDVDKSIEGKLKCLVFIPILSRTYCDLKSYAWQYEFCAFNKAALHDKFGRDIKLRSGNVASRILPVSIHDLDPEDRDLFEHELKSKLRSVDFIFRSPGVNRPLRRDDKREESLNRLVYRDQINKVANAIKEIMNGMKYPEKTSDTIFRTFFEDFGQDADAVSELEAKAEKELNEKSIAVLPFVSLAQDASQDYFADGITENILIQLASLKNLRVISRTSVMRYKKTTKTAPEIAEELGVKYILEGSAQSHANKVRINVQLIDAQKDDHLWSKVFVESMDDIFTIQANVAEVVAKELRSSLDPGTDEKLKEVPTKNLEAYDLFLKGRHAFNQWSVQGYKTASEYFKKALEKDPEFKQAYSYLASSYSARMSWNGDLSPEEGVKHINQYLEEAWKRGATDNDYLTKGVVEFFVHKNLPSAESLLLQAIDISANNATVLYMYSYVLSMMGRYEEALKYVTKASKIEPHSVAYFNYQGICQYLLGRYDDAVSTWKEGKKLFPMVLRFSDHLGRAYLTMGNYNDAIDVITAGLRTATIRPPSMVAYLAASQAGLGKLEKANELLQELVQRSNDNEKGVNYYILHIECALGNYQEGEHWLQKARSTNDIDLIWLNVDPLLNSFREAGTGAGPVRTDFEGAEKFIIEKLRKEWPDDLSYHNIDHIYDVVDSAMNIAEGESLTEQEIGLLRIAALYHDAGFISSARDHEENGCALAKETLPAFGFNDTQLEAICGMIKATKLPQSPKTKLEKILCDADLDYLGREDFYTVGDRLFHEMKSRGFIETEREWNLIQKTFLENHRYHTPFAREKREQRKQQHLKEIAARLLIR